MTELPEDSREMLKHIKVRFSNPLLLFGPNDADVNWLIETLTSTLATNEELKREKREDKEFQTMRDYAKKLERENATLRRHVRKLEDAVKEITHSKMETNPDAH